MCWDFCVSSKPTARKEYDCQAKDWIVNGINNGAEFSEDDQKIIDHARSEDWKIKKGTQYAKTQGMWEGEFEVFRARKDLDLICMKYALYPE